MYQNYPLALKQNHKNIFPACKKKEIWVYKQATRINLFRTMYTKLQIYMYFRKQEIYILNWQIIIQNWWIVNRIYMLKITNTWHCMTLGLFTRERITFRKTFRNVIRPFLIWKPDLPFVNAKLFQIGLLKCLWNTKKGAFWIVIRVESLILGHVNTKLFRNVIHACAFWKCTLKPCMGQSARTAQ